MPLRALRILQLDESDRQVYNPVAAAGELVVPGAFMFTFAETDPAALEGPDLQAFRSGFLGVDSFGWGTLVAVGDATAEDREYLLERLTTLFLERFGAPSADAAREQAEEELGFADHLCQQPLNTILSVERSLDSAGGVREQFRTHRQEASWEGQHPVFSIVPDEDDLAPPGRETK